MMALYNTLILPLLSYCIEVWGGAFKTRLNQLLVVQKKVIRIISAAEFNAHTDPLFKELNVLKINQLYIFKTFLFMFKYHKQVLPEIFKDLFIYSSSVHGYNTRHASNENFLSNLAASTRRTQTIRFNGVKIWNTLSNLIDVNCSLPALKNKIKYFLIHNEFDI